jgi:hypothetical protein
MHYEPGASLCSALTAPQRAGTKLAFRNKHYKYCKYGVAALVSHRLGTLINTTLPMTNAIPPATSLAICADPLATNLVAKPAVAKIFMPSLDWPAPAGEGKPGKSLQAEGVLSQVLIAKSYILNIRFLTRNILLSS